MRQGFKKFQRCHARLHRDRRCSRACVMAATWPTALVSTASAAMPAGKPGGPFGAACRPRLSAARCARRRGPARVDARAGGPPCRRAGARRAAATRRLIVQRRARAWIDLNRAEDERDPLIDRRRARRFAGAHRSDQVRSGLGLVPRRAAPGGDALAAPASPTTRCAERIAEDHRPYHAALAEALAAARDRFGVGAADRPPFDAAAAAARRHRRRVVLGDRFGRSAALGWSSPRRGRSRRRRADRSRSTRPMPAGISSSRHGRPAGGIHAIQVEIDRTLYLDAELNAPARARPDRRAAAPDHRRRRRRVARRRIALADSAIAAE